MQTRLLTNNSVRLIFLMIFQINFVACIQTKLFRLPSSLSVIVTDLVASDCLAELVKLSKALSLVSCFNAPSKDREKVNTKNPGP